MDIKIITFNHYIFNNYKNMKNRPMRDYSYTNTNEFIAESIAYYYYYKYKNTIAPAKGNPLTSDIVSLVEKYISFAQNGYK